MIDYQRTKNWASRSRLDIMLTFDAWGLAMLLHHVDEHRAKVTKKCELGGRDEKLNDEAIRLYVDPVLILAQVHAKDAQLWSTLDRVTRPSCHASRTVHRTP